MDYSSLLRLTLDQPEGVLFARFQADLRAGIPVLGNASLDDAFNELRRNLRGGLSLGDQWRHFGTVEEYGGVDQIRQLLEDLAMGQDGLLTAVHPDCPADVRGLCWNFVQDDGQLSLGASLTEADVIQDLPQDIAFNSLLATVIALSLDLRPNRLVLDVDRLGLSESLVFDARKFADEAGRLVTPNFEPLRGRGFRAFRILEEIGSIETDLVG